MKYGIMFLTALAICTACSDKKETESISKNYSTSTNDNPTYEKTYGYIAYNGKRASVTFKKTKKEHTINIMSNGSTFNLDYQKDTEHGQLFSRNGIEAETINDSLYIRSGSTIIELAKVK